MSDNRNMEDFFRNRLESGRFAYQEEDWAKLESKMGAAGMFEEKSGITVNTTMAIVGGIALLLIGFLLGWLFMNHGDSEIAPEVNSTSRTGEVRFDGAEGVEEFTDSEEAKILDESIGQVNDKKFSIPTTSAADESVEDAGSIETPKTHGSQPTPWDEFESPPPLGYAMHSDFTVNLNVGEMEKNKAKITLDKQNITSDKGFYVGLSFAPDLNSIGLDASKSLTAKFGLQLFYAFSERWGLSTGVYYNKKKYETSAEKYSPPDGYWDYQNGQKPSSIFGRCGVVDVPLNLYFSFLDRGKWDLSVSAGMSSYILLDEAYDFEYGPYNYSTGTDGWYTDENSTVFMGVFNASMQVGLALNDRSSLLAEPYVQLPFKDIGWGKINLVSSGIMFTYRYRMFKAGLNQIKQK